MHILKEDGTSVTEEDIKKTKNSLRNFLIKDIFELSKYKITDVNAQRILFTTVNFMKQKTEEPEWKKYLNSEEFKRIIKENDDKMIKSFVEWNKNIENYNKKNL